MKIREHMALFSIAMTTIIVLWANAEAKEFIGNSQKEEGAIWNQIKEVEQDIANSNEKLVNLHESAGLVENHINVKQELKNDLNALLMDVHENGSIQISEPFQEKSLDTATIGELNLAKITRAVAIAETGNGKTGSGRDYNNICGIMYWWYEDGQRMRDYVRYDSYMDGFNACASLLNRKYSDYTIEGMAVKWTGNDRVDNWVKNVKASYKNQE